MKTSIAAFLVASVLIGSHATQAKDTFVRVQPELLLLPSPLANGKKLKLRLYVNTAYDVSKNGSSTPDFSVGDATQIICNVVGDGSSSIPNIAEACGDTFVSVSDLRRAAERLKISPKKAVISFAFRSSKFNLGNHMGFANTTLAGGTISLDELNSCRSRQSCIAKSSEKYGLPNARATMTVTFE